MALDYKSGLSRYRRYLQVVREQPLVRAGIWTALSLVLVIVMITMALKPTLVVIASLLGQIRQNREILAKLDDKIIKIQQAATQLDSIALRLPILDEAIPTVPDWEKWSLSIVQMASQSGVQLLSVNIGPAPIEGKLEVAKPEVTDLPAEISGLNFTISATGDYDKLRQLVKAIENTRRLGVLSTVQFMSVKNKTGSTDLTVYIKGATVYSPVITNQ